MRSPPPLEHTIEGAVVRWARAQGWRVRKMNGLGDRAWPDRMFLAPAGGVTAFIEFKRPGERPTPLQAKTLDDLTRRGHHATWYDNSAAAIEWLRSLEPEAVPAASGAVHAGARRRRTAT